MLMKMLRKTLTLSIELTFENSYSGGSTFSKVSSLLNLLQWMTAELTFGNCDQGERRCKCD